MSVSMKPLMDKRVLLIAPRFFGYDQDIADHLLELGAEVDLLPDRPFDTPFMTMLARFFRPIIMEPSTRFYRRMVAEKGRTYYDLILVISGQTVSKEILTEFRQSFPSAMLVLYMYDSLANRKTPLSKLYLFDDCLTFDPDDAKKFGMKFRPLFFSNGFAFPRNSTKFKYHLSFVGTAHTDRYAIVRKVSKSVGDTYNCYWYLFLQAPWVFYAYKLFNPGFRSARMSDFRFASLSKKKVQNIFGASLAILDIEHPKQTGLTMRTFEALGSSKKLVTTNYRIVDYDFYRKENICIIDRIKPSIPDTFLNSPYFSLENNIYDKYRISGWAKDVLASVMPDP